MTDGDSAPLTLDEATALRIRRLELDIDDLRAENARLKGSIAQRQDEIVLQGERGAALVAEIVELKRGLDARTGLLWPVRAIARRLDLKRQRGA